MFNSAFTLPRTSLAAFCSLWPRPSKTKVVCPTPAPARTERWCDTVLFASESALFFFLLAEPAWPEAVCFCEGSPFFGGGDDLGVEVAGGFGFAPPAACALPKRPKSRR